MTKCPIPVVHDPEACRWLSGLFARELDDSAIAAYTNGAADPMLRYLAEERGLVSEVRRVCRAIADWTILANKRLVLAADFATLFLADGKLGAPPYASIYLDPEGRMLQAPHERMVRRLSHLGLEVRHDLKEPADHLAVMLEYLALRLEQPDSGPDEGCVDDRADLFVRSELLTWVHTLRDRATQVATKSDFHPGCIALTCEYLVALG